MKKLILVFLMAFNVVVFSRDLKVSIAQLPGLSETAEKGLLIDLVKEMQNHYTDGKLIITGVFPFERSIQNVIKGDADFHIPILRNNTIEKSELPYMESTSSFRKAVFVLYTNINRKEITPKNVSNYKIGTDIGHVRFFNFPVEGKVNPEVALKMLETQRLDGWIFAQDVTDQAVKNLKIKDLHKQEYMPVDVVFVLQKSENGKAVDQILSTIISKMKADGTLKKIFGPSYEEKFIPDLK